MIDAVIADAWIDNNSANSNKGTDSILKVQAKGPRDNFRGLVRFNLPTDVPAGCVVEFRHPASLRRLVAQWTHDPGAAHHGNWTENGVTWNNQPATTGPAATTASGSGWRQWDVKDQVQAMVNSGINGGFLIRDANEGGNGFEQQFHAREKGQNVPMLLITFAPAGG